MNKDRRTSRAGEATGVRFVGSVSGLILPPGALVMANPDGEERRYAAPRERKLGSEQEHAIRVAAMRGSTLRVLAVDHGVSHQTVACIVRGHSSSSSATKTDLGALASAAAADD